MRRAISFLAKIIYRNQYEILKRKARIAHVQTVQANTQLKDSIAEKLLISGEDHRFRYHFGFDVLAIIRAVKNKILHNRREGASTIEQQLVRVLTGDFSKTLNRKIKEIFLSTTLREIIPRDEIPSVYLYHAYYGTNMNGICGLFARYKTEIDSTISEDFAADIVARIKYPEPKTPNERRTTQIMFRKKHLMHLYQKHNSRKWIKIYK